MYVNIIPTLPPVHLYTKLHDGMTYYVVGAKDILLISKTNSHSPLPTLDVLPHMIEALTPVVLSIWPNTAAFTKLSRVSSNDALLRVHNSSFLIEYLDTEDILPL